MKRRILSIITALALCLSLCPTWALAAEADPALCPHHREHTDECYTLEVLPDTDSGDDYEIGADTENLLDCQHTHDSECGYAQADPGQPCGYECRICPIEDLIATLPDTVTADNADGVRAQLDQIRALFSELTEDEQEQIDLSRCYVLQEALDGANAPMLAAEGAVTITDKNGNAVTLKDGKYYTVNSGPVGGVTEQDTAPEGNVCYLTYANGVLTAYHSNTIYGTVSVTSDLTVKSEPQGSGLVLVGSTAPVLSLNSHTLTLDSATSLNVQGVFPPSDCAVEGGTIQCSSQSASALISINNMFGLAAKDLTVQNAANVQISGNTNSGGVVENLTVINSSVAIRQGSSSNPTIVVENQITTDTPVLLQRPDFENGNGELITEAIAAADGKIWAYSGEAPTDELDINDAVTANTCWKAGDGMIYYEPAGDGGAARLTLDNASYEGNVYVSADSVEMVLTGGNQIGMIYADKATLTGSGSFTGMIDVNKNGFINNSSGKLNAMVILNDADDYGNCIIYGERSTADISPDYPIILSSEGNFLTIAPGATLTVNDVGEDTPGLIISDTTKLSNQGTLVNNGTVGLADAAAEGDVSAYIKSLGLTGSGTVQVATKNVDGEDVLETYTNSGLRLRDTAGTLDLSNPTNLPEDGAAKGYSWDEATKTLTIQEGFNAEKVLLPDDTVTIVTAGESIIKELAVSGNNPQKTNLTLSGPGKLTVQECLNISGGNNLSLTVAAGAQVEALGGVTVSASGGADAVVTVNGMLTAKGNESEFALNSGKVVVGSGGKLNVYGENGVQLNGINSESGKTFVGVFTLQEDGTLYAECKKHVIAVYSGTGNAFDPPVKPEEAISVPEGYIPQDHEPKLTGDSIVIMGNGNPLTISKVNVPNPPVDPNPGGSSGGGGTISTYAVTVEKSEHGKVTSNRTNASNGSTVTLTVTPDSGYVLDALTVTDSRGNEIKLTVQGGNKYTFTMPSRAVTVKASFVPLPDDTQKPCNGGADCPSRDFSDLGSVGTWYHEAVDYVLRNDLMGGYGNGLFGPNDNLSRAQFAQILFNKEGRPVVNYLLQYGDVAEGAWYTEAIRWATSRGIVGGYGNGTFGPNDNITCEQLAVMLWRYAGSPAATDKELHFTDADQASGFALDALRWAVEKGIINGYGNGQLAPQGLATRGQVAQMLMNFLKNR